MNANLIFKWLRDPRFAGDEAAAGEAVFLPVEVTATNMSPVPSLPDRDPVRPTGSRIEIELANGHRLTAEGSFDGDTIARLLKGLAS
jgi:transposase